jgi:signal peptidase
LLRDFILVLILLMIVASLPAALRKLEDAPSYPLAVVSGVSMEPLLHSGDVVFIEKVNPSNVKVGDIIVYKWVNGKYIIHRVVKVYEFNGKLCFVTWGDDRRTNPIPDPGYPSICGYIKVEDPLSGSTLIASGIPSSEVIGKVVQIGNYIFKIPYIGTLALVIKSS